jgi:hypothetical protein
MDGEQTKPLSSNSEERLHPALDVVVHVAVEKPCPHVVGDHVSHDHHHRFEVNHVHAHGIENHGLAMPMRSVNFIFVTVREQVPTDSLSLFHSHHRHIAFDKSIEIVGGTFGGLLGR